jgi:pimeloyl-ACP methyl ester carboxylesterase
MWDEPEAPQQDLDLRLLRVGAQPLDDSGALRVVLDTTRGTIEGILHPFEGGTSAVICVGGALGGLEGPADSLYPRLPLLLSSAKVTVLRIEYRKPNEFEECVLDALAGCSFLKGIGATDLVLVGHSFGGAVVIKAGELHDLVRGVASLSPQLYGTRQVENLNRPLLLVHGMSDNVLSHEASEDIYRRALEPKRIVLFAEAGHSLIQAKDQIDELLAEWIAARLAGVPDVGGREEHEAS